MKLHAHTMTAFAIKLKPNVKTFFFYKASPTLDRNERNVLLLHLSEACLIWNSLNYQTGYQFLEHNALSVQHLVGSHEFFLFTA